MIFLSFFIFNSLVLKIEEQQRKALEEDPSAFDYDGVYDEMKEKTLRPRQQDRDDRKVFFTYVAGRCAKAVVKVI